MTTDQTRVPDACTLPARRQAAAVAGFDELFGHVLGIERPHARLLRLRLTPTEAVATEAAALAVRETACCSFVGFTLSASEGTLALEIGVTAGYTEVLDALAARVVAAGTIGS